MADNERFRIGLVHADKIIIDKELIFKAGGTIKTSGDGNIRFLPDGDGGVYVRDVQIPATNIDFEDEGVFQGAASLIDVVGAGAQVVVSGGKATLNVGGASGILEIQKDSVKIDDASILDYVGTGVDVGVAGGIATIDFPEVPDVTLRVNPNYNDSAAFSQYSTIPAAVTRAQALITGGATSVLVYVETGVHPFQAKQVVSDGIIIQFAPRAEFDFTGFAGTNTMFELYGFNCGLVDADLTFGLLGAHPFTGGKFISVIDNTGAGSAQTQAVLRNVWCWDQQGGATEGLYIGGKDVISGTAKPIVLIDEGLFSLATSIATIEQYGENELRIINFTRIGGVFGDGILLTDEVANPNGPELQMEVTSAGTLLGGYVINKSGLKSNIIGFEKSIFPIDQCNGIVGTDMVGMLNSEEIFQDEYPHATDPDPDKYSLGRGLVQIKTDISDLSNGHDHDGVDSKQVDYPDLTNIPSTFAPSAHTIGGSAHSSDTLANLNSKISDATLDDSGDPRDPNNHASSHESSGADKVNHDNLDGFVASEHWNGNDSGTGSTEVWSAQKINNELSALSSGIIRKKAVIDYVDCTAVPPTEVNGDRYILDFTVGTVNAAWDGASKGDIVQFNGATWDAETPAEGWIAYVDAENKDRLYVDDGSPDWEQREPYPGPHAIGGAEHTTDTLANLNSKITDATLDDSGDPRDPNNHASNHTDGTDDIQNASTSQKGLATAAQITMLEDHNARHESGGADAIKLDDLATPDDNTDLNASTSAHGLMKKLSNNDNQYLSGQGNWNPIFPSFQFFADQMENPVNSDWAVNALAPASGDPVNAGLTVRRFDDTTEEGIGFSVQIPAGATNIRFDIMSKAITAPGSAQGVVPKLYVREVPDNAAVEAWSAGTNLTTISIPTNANFQYDNQTIDLTTLSLVAGRIAQFELTRVGTDGSDTLSGDWAVLMIKVSFT